jgi:hypothetical protein
MGNERDDAIRRVGAMTKLRVFRDGDSRWVCVNCELEGVPREYDAHDSSDMLEHLRKHRLQGDELPEAEVNALLREFWEERR